jgi:CRP/FNR family transcriptional regulator, cyclic AMP receptor protein
MNVRAEADAFRQVPLFAQCDPAHLQVIAFSSEKVEFPDGAALIRQGKTGDSGFLILRGQARAQATDSKGARDLGDIGPGVFVGEIGMIAGAPYSITVTATGKVIAARVTRDLFLRVAREFPDFGMRVQASIAAKLEGTVGELKSVKKVFDQAAEFSRR